ncbi:MAG: GHKL domain-containing protein [Ruminococcus sp.]|nr:GHKL domain-containing protein [Ruminococcus sp.]
MEGIVTLISFDAENVSMQKKFSELFLLILMIVMFAIMLLLIINNMSKKYFKDTSDLLLKQIDTQLRHYEALDDMKKEFHSFRHDYINHMQCVAALISSNKNEEAVQYINKLSNSKTITEKPYECGNHILDSILTEKAAAAKKCDTEICLDGLFTHDFDPVDLCVIFSNALDNAIEACRKIGGHKTIDVKLNIQQGYQFISISNPTNEENNSLLTTKDDKTHHRFGINNIRNAVNRHNGTFDLSNGNGLFCINILLKL